MADYIPHNTMIMRPSASEPPSPKRDFLVLGLCILILISFIAFAIFALGRIQQLERRVSYLEQVNQLENPLSDEELTPDDNASVPTGEDTNSQQDVAEEDGDQGLDINNLVPGGDDTHEEEDGGQGLDINSLVPGGSTES